MIFSTKTFQHFATVPDRYTMSATISPTWQRQKKTTHFPCPDVCTPLCLYLHFSDLQTNQIFQYSIKNYPIGSHLKFFGVTMENCKNGVFLLLNFLGIQVLAPQKWFLLQNQWFWRLSVLIKLCMNYYVWTIWHYLTIPLSSSVLWKPHFLRFFT